MTVAHGSFLRMPLPLPNSFRKALKQPDPVDPNGEDDEDEDADAIPKGGKENPLKRWAQAKVGNTTPGSAPTTR